MNDKALWERFSIYIRLRDTDHEGYGPCITCGRPLFWKKGDCGHGHSRAHMATKYDEKNNHLQCKPCNGFHGGKREVYEKAINKKYGPQTWELLEIKSKGVCKWGDFEIKALARHYQQEAEKLAKARGFILTFKYSI